MLLFAGDDADIPNTAKTFQKTPASPKNGLALLRSARTSDSETLLKKALKSVTTWSRFATLPKTLQKIYIALENTAAKRIETQ